MVRCSARATHQRKYLADCFLALSCYGFKVIYRVGEIRSVRSRQFRQCSEQEELQGAGAETGAVEGDEAGAGGAGSVWDNFLVISFFDKTVSFKCLFSFKILLNSSGTF